MGLQEHITKLMVGFTISI